MRDGGPPDPRGAGLRGPGLVDEIDALLTAVPFVSCADVALAEDAVIDALAAVLRKHAATIALPCLASAVRTAWIDQAMERGSVTDCLRGLALEHVVVGRAAAVRHALR